MTLAPGSAQVLQDYGLFAVLMGRKDAGIAAARRAVSLDPQNRNTHHLLALVFDAVGQYQDEIAALHDAKILDPNDAPTFESQPYYKVGNYQSAREICERKPERWDNQYGLALIYDKLGRHTDAEGELTKLKAALGDSAAYQYAEIYAQWSNAPKALEWLETALRLRDPGLEYLKTDPLLDPIRREPRFQAIERELKFPD
jgi:tetratricopeptide (TPR) repeat protein